MAEPYSECKVMIDYPGRLGSRINKKEGKVLYCEENGVPRLRILQGKKETTFDLDSPDLVSFKINAQRISDGLISFQFSYSYGMLCNVLLSDPLTLNGFYNLVDALARHIH
ncbi:hypothetical protein ENUP19_0367G0007 [Entamoeba nuttalli]|uniref:Uncharacterized protein n=2 Tax=Entamoeba nuttalli TaxID=412467 RepID=K2HJ56_ENTNP|nr:hypothetical protein ENU1_000520 [Entamoeba nuttalli P19]EKE43039.1 hypothetical protein ENU1_000520 [Entamoeba nuttalli P19]|eukprot:XP_008854626.1 hypothetical protein ENU1_000520 [Entamoeba nuttalli P19]